MRSTPVISAILALALAAPAWAANVTVVGEDNRTPIGGALTPVGCAQITSLAAATPLTAPAGATAAVVIAEGQGVRYRDDGAAPTASVGQPLAAGQPLQILGLAELSAIQFIQQAASATLDLCFYK